MSKVVVVGGNFAGLTGALHLRHLLGDAVEITLISKDDHFVFIPSLIWVPFGWRTPQDISFPLAPVLERAKIHFVHAPATRIDPHRKIVHTTAGEFSYEYLLIATGPYPQYEIVPGLGPSQYTYSVCTLDHALHAHEGWKRFVDDPGPVVIGATQGASCFGAAYEFLFNFAHALRKARLTRRAPITFITAEPFCGHFGIGGLKGGQQMLEFFLKKLGIRWLTNVGVQEIVPGEVHLSGRADLAVQVCHDHPALLGSGSDSQLSWRGEREGVHPRQADVSASAFL
jgi:NADPH-dependent 2,4-dienoyl-CoA reductase/sulfur reductase-like enzyme